MWITSTSYLGILKVTEGRRLKTLRSGPQGVKSCMFRVEESEKEGLEVSKQRI